MNGALRARKGSRTRERILASAASLFNRKGYAATSISDILAVAGLRKGGLYRHFAKKEALATAAFDFAARAVADHHRGTGQRATTAAQRLHALIDAFGDLETAPPIGGGCPLFNAAIEADDGDAALRAPVERALGAFHTRVADIVRSGVAAREFDAGVDPAAVASVFLAALEGALVLARLHRDPRHLERVGAHLTAYVATFAAGHP